MTTETKTNSTNPKFHTEPMEGYKAFDEDLCCQNDFQYEIGKTYTMDEEPEICDHGFHFCKSIIDCYQYYPFGSRICKIRAEGRIVGDNEDDFDQSRKYCTNQITILEEITDESLLHANADGSTEGYANTGRRNTGDCNTGRRTKKKQTTQSTRLQVAA